MTVDLQAALDVALSAAREAGEIVMQGFRSETAVRTKANPADLVTQYDLKSEDAIRARIALSYPQHKIVAEESEARGAGELVWYVDPLDGTSNFAHGHFCFCVSIALYQGEEPLVGVVHAPALATTWAAARGRGTTRNGVRCGVSATDSLRRALCGTGFAASAIGAPDDNIAEFAKLTKETHGVRRMGAAALELAFVSDGAYDAFWDQRLGPWDIAAGILLVREAGGRATDRAGREASPRDGLVAATNGLIHDSFLDSLRSGSA
jgi:myo-inositol-1(or 4)-monophosphatase